MIVPTAEESAFLRRVGSACEARAEQTRQAAELLRPFVAAIWPKPQPAPCSPCAAAALARRQRTMSLGMAVGASLMFAGMGVLAYEATV